MSQTSAEPDQQLLSVRIVNRILPLLPEQLSELVSAVMDSWQTARARQVVLLSAGLAYHAFLAIFPALIAGVLLFGLFADPAEIISLTTRATAGLPDEAQALIVDQVQVLVNEPAGLGAGLVVSLVVAVVSASSGISNLMTAVNATYGIVQRRSYLKRRIISFGAMLGAVVFMVVMLGMVAVVPALLSFVNIGGAPRWALEVGRWLITAAVFSGALSLIYRFFPENPPPSFRWASLGALIATLVFLIASAGYSLYISNFSSLTKTYGTLAGIVITLIWFWMLSLSVLFGAQINVEVAHRSVRAREAVEAARAEAAARAAAERAEEEAEADEKSKRAVTTRSGAADASAGDD